ncbi:MAG TPA: DUF2240 family protein [Methanomassiliicoccales archaeon]|nr:DUF2240 family protein [Methanomassiliicoccales archaeon]
MTELETCLALLFKRKGKTLLTEKEFVFSASMDFRWLSPRDAQALLEIGIKRGLLERSEGFVKPAFNYKDVEVPATFKPCAEMLKDVEPEQSIFSQILDAIAKVTGQKKREIVARVNKVQERLGVDVEVAALAVAKEVGVDVSLFDQKVKEEILARY